MFHQKLQELQSTVPLLYLVSLLHGVSLGLPVLTISATSHHIQGKDATLATPFTASLRASEFRLADTAVPMCRPRVQPSHLPWAACHGDRLLGAQTRCRNSILFTWVKVKPHYAIVSAVKNDGKLMKTDMISTYKHHQTLVFPFSHFQTRFWNFLEDLGNIWGDFWHDNPSELGYDPLSKPFWVVLIILVSSHDKSFEVAYVSDIFFFGWLLVLTQKRASNILNFSFFVKVCLIMISLSKLMPNIKTTTHTPRKQCPL